MAITSKERRVGEIFSFKDKWYQVFKDDCNNCFKCAFYNGGARTCTEDAKGVIGRCSQEHRDDKVPVYFLEVPKPPISYTKRINLLLLV